ncbi:voltage-dependent calcium channel gamma-5 subunit isoform X1 [Mastomys coucha]|uniref:voltage-dependent calcium channel gamma-5 subunit isoform X1 n=1 Tax=Mastomys coucha TaxID=35658 RepID=UPI001262888C|nr:voltage-dependent calcium channel gamma-5 subunit isoform X1 [Mastomys coucha]XP_031209505.1 voltage-dependent calcium channel gamma-5 subunit isoform X1 [Mastomys coucha]XP_031209506.1 voltage-dependent calcium channel gamma-5 subunit isoform X1 [Mastomys coucha]
MSACGRKALTLLSSVFAVCGLGLLGIAVSTDYWLYLEEGIILPQNQSTEVKMSLHSGLWRVCFLAGEERGRCFTIEYVMPMNSQMTSESTVNVLKMIRSATPFPLVSLFFMFIGFILSNIGHIRPHRTILAFVSGIFFILSGLSLVVGLVLYISSINDEMLNRTKDAETYFNYKYGWSFAFAAISFLLTEVICPIPPCARLVLPYLEGRREASHRILDHPPTLLQNVPLSLAFLALFYPGGSQGPRLSTHVLAVPLERSLAVSQEDTAGTSQEDPHQ